MQLFDPAILSDLVVPKNDSHKGENGRLLVIGGSELFHASIFWSADVASKIVDLVHFTSPTNENNELVRIKLKEGFWNGIVVDYADVAAYIAEDDCVLIGPGMPRVEGLGEVEVATEVIVNTLVGEYEQMRWVVDGGALQEIRPELLNGAHIITPHQGEWDRLIDKTHDSRFTIHDWDDVEERAEKASLFSVAHGEVVVLAKGKQDVVVQGEAAVRIKGGNAGMTKGGTGDVLAGIVGAFYCTSDAFVAAQAASYVNKQAANLLYEQVGVYFNASDLVEAVAVVLGELTSS